MYFSFAYLVHFIGSGKRVQTVSAGDNFSAVILDNGLVYTWGGGEYGKLGHG